MLLTVAVFLDKKEYIAGITKSVRKVEKINPPITAIPIETLLSEPAPRANAIGRIPSTVERLVIRIGLKREIAALITASVFSSPAAVRTCPGCKPWPSKKRTSGSSTAASPMS